MATALKIKSDIKRLKQAINSKASKDFLPKLKAQLEKAENELKIIQSGGVKKVSTTTSTQKTLSALEKLVNSTKKYSIYRGQNVDLKKDSEDGALKLGRRVSKGIKGNQYASKSEAKGNVYYEYRPNRLDVKQPKKAQSYPKLEDGGMMEKGGSVENSEMLHNQITNILHHANELHKLVKKHHEVEPWVITKAQRAATDLADITHYLEGESKEYADGGYMAKGGKQPVVTRGFIDDEPYEYGDGGNTSYGEHGEMHRNEQ